MFRKLLDLIKAKGPAVLEQAGRALRYLYYLRFSILLWFFPLVLIAANSPRRARSLVSGIATPVNLTQYLCTAFFMVAASQVALIVARIVVINGEARFGDKPPAWMTWLLATDKGRFELLPLLATQLNTVVVFVYFYVNGVAEGVDGSAVLYGVLAGTVLGAVFWFVISGLYYLSYRPAEAAAAVPRASGGAAAHTFVAPRALLFMSPVAPAKGAATERRFGDVLEDCVPVVRLNWIRYAFPIPGYRVVPRGDLYEGHFLSLIASFGFYALYWILFPLTAPVPVELWSNVALGLLSFGTVCLLVFVLAARPKQPGDAARLGIWKGLLAVPILLFPIALIVLYAQVDAERFPILALVLIFVIGCAWTLGGIAFFADRFRIPVLTVVLLFTAIPRMAHWDHGREEHFLSTASTTSSAPLPTPADILADKLAANPGEPLVIVTSTGGGIHAAAWTAAILRQLEIRFAKNPALGNFHGHVLLMSTVSGGSSGLYTYLRELDPKTNDGRPDWSRMVLSAQCSSLESVGWGLIYYDVGKAFVPFFPYFVEPSPGVDDLESSPLGKDRTWALRKAFARNLHDPYCLARRLSGGRIPLRDLRSAAHQDQLDENDLTLRAFDATQPAIPAFSMNTTVVENGERFLSANYRIPGDLSGMQGDYRARSFLSTYSSAAHPSDLPLATAAQMSATFPMVSSAARVPLALDSSPAAVHFVDGGYYDNDGTATAIEFLRYAFAGFSPPPSGSAVQTKTVESAPQPAGPVAPVRILIVEIRNSGDDSPSGPESNPDHSGGTSLWNLNNQLTAPLQAFWSAGHESVTGRNRVTLGLLEKSLAGKALIRHIVIDDVHAVDRTRTDPLNWSLTPQQQQEIWGSAYKARDCYEKVVTWFLTPPAGWQAGAQSPEIACNAAGPAQNSAGK
jgi:hypothetical protein